MKIFSEAIPCWRYTSPAPLNTKLLLLTHDGVCVVGVWKGPALDGTPAPAGERPNSMYRGWAGLPERDKVVESKLGWR